MTCLPRPLALFHACPLRKFVSTVLQAVLTLWPVWVFVVRCFAQVKRGSILDKCVKFTEFTGAVSGNSFLLLEFTYPLAGEQSLRTWTLLVLQSETVKIDLITVLTYA